MMKTLPVRPRAALLIGAAFLATPALAQETPASPAQSVTPPPIMVTPQAAPATAPERVIEMQAPSPVVQRTPVEPEAAPAARTTASRPVAAPARQSRASNAARPATEAPRAQPAAAAEPAPAPEIAQIPAETVAAVGGPVAETGPAIAETVPVATQSTSEESTRSTTPWALLVGGIVLVLAGAAALFLLMRRRRSEDEEYVETPMYAAEPEPAQFEPADPIVVAQPETAPFIAAPEPVSAEALDTAELAAADSDDLAGIAGADAPVSGRPWLEFALRPLRAGTSADEALVDLELTVGNSGDTPARDVRIATFMLAEASTGDVERLLVQHRGDSSVPPVTIAPGDGTRVDAHLAVPKGALGDSFNPVVVAEARYAMADGSEGRTSAAFRIGGAGIAAIDTRRPRMIEDVEAELFGIPEHA